MQILTIAPRFCGPPGTGNGGYASGLFAQHARATVRDRPEAVVRPHAMNFWIPVIRARRQVLRLAIDID